MKKMLVIVLFAVMLFNLAACATVAPTTEPSKTDQTTQLTTTEQTQSTTPENFGGYKIGCYFLPESLEISQQFRRAMNWAANLTNCEMVYYDIVNYSTEEMMTAHESLVAQGCDGIIFIVPAGPRVFEMFNEKGVYYVGLSRTLTEDVAAVTNTSKYCAGFGDERSGISWFDAYGPLSVLAKQGVKKIAYISGPLVSELATERVRGITDACKDFGMEVITSYEGSDYAAGAADILANYGDELDGMIGCMNGDVVIAALQSAGYAGKIKYAQVDPPNDVANYMDADILHATIAGNNTFIVQMYMQLFNAMSGSERLFTDGNKLFPIHKSLLIDSADTYRLCEEYVLGDVPGMTPDEVLQFNSIYNPDFDVKEYEAIWQARIDPEYWNVNSIVERLSKD